MKVRDLVRALDLKVRTTECSLDGEVTGAYCSDMLSDVIGHASEGQVWLTIQTHQNVAAVASLLNLSAVVVTAGKEPSAELLAKAQREGTPILTTDRTTFEAAGRLYALLSRDG